MKTGRTEVENCAGALHATLKIMRHNGKFSFPISSGNLERKMQERIDE
jgi:hypothetical protein